MQKMITFELHTSVLGENTMHVMVSLSLYNMCSPSVQKYKITKPTNTLYAFSWGREKCGIARVCLPPPVLLPRITGPFYKILRPAQLCK